MGRFRYIAAIGVGLVAVLASGCGSSSGYSAPSVVHPALLPAQQPLEKQVDAMVVTGGDIAGWKIVTRGFEKLDDQLAKRGTVGGPGANRFIRAHWQASYHTILRSSGKLVASDANVFDSAASAQRVRQYQHDLRPKGESLRQLPVPNGAPPGAEFSYQHSTKSSGYVLEWTQGPVIALTLIVTDHRLSAAETKTAGQVLTAAASKQADRISKVMEAHAASMAAK